MEDREIRREERKNKIHSGSSRVWTGAFIVVIGIAALLRTTLPDLPDWVFSWQTFLIALGFFLGIRHNFHGAAWFILMLVGGIFLTDEFFPRLIMKEYLWPMGLILLGLFLIFRPRRRNWDWRQHVPPHILNKVEGETDETKYYSSEDYIDSTSIFGGIKKNILSKKFSGGDIVNIMGGTEINLMQADITGAVILEVTQIFGGTKLIVPSNWEIKPEIVAIFGGIEDKRTMQNVSGNADKILVLKGTTLFGGIEIKNY
jgi:predicted membrane protein